MVCEHCGTIFCWDEADNAPMDGRNRKRFCSEHCKKRASAKRTGKNVNSEQRRRNSALRYELTICETRGKQRYTDIVAARQGAGRVLQHKGWVLYPYLCVCGFWHLTKNVPKSTEDSWFYGNRVEDLFIAKEIVRSD